jgi:hypothetical protein
MATAEAVNPGRETELATGAGASAPSKEVADKGTPRSLAVAKRGVKTSHDFSNFMSALMSDLIEGNIAPQVGNAACNAGGKMLKVVEMQYKYGTVGKDGTPKTLVLSLQE